MLHLNPILRTDSYKTSHFAQYPKGMTHLSSYIEPRGGAFKSAVFFGLQAFIKQYLQTPICHGDIDEAQSLLTAHGVPFNRAGWTRIVDKWHGFLPLEIEAVPEGLVMTPSNVQVQITNTDPELAWLTSYVETALLRAIWYPSTVASQSRALKQIIYAGLVKSSDNPRDQLPFKLHDFGARGATGSETAMLGGMAHLVNFKGTDTLEGVFGAREYYGADMAGISIPASEHSTMTTWGQNQEESAYRNLLEQFPNGAVACVSDSYDIFNAVEKIWGGALKSLIENRTGTLIVRPDSGDAVAMPLQVIEMLMAKFGYKTNQKGYKVLPDFIRVIQGDGMNQITITRLIDRAIARGLSVDNFAMGMGAGLLQNINRDTMNYAMKANAVMIDGVWHDVFKNPITAPEKSSKKGRLALVERGGGFVTVGERAVKKGEQNILRPVYRNGELLIDEGFDTIKARADI